LSHFQNSVSFENGFAVSRLRLRNMRFLAVAFPKTEVLEKPRFTENIPDRRGKVKGTLKKPHPEFVEKVYFGDF